MDIELIEKSEKVQEDIKKQPVKILSHDETLDLLINSTKSIARFGDGELKIINGRRVGFQEENSELGKRLEEVLCSKQDFCLIGILDELNGYENHKEDATEYWIKYLYDYRDVWLKYVDVNREYCSANITRPYMAYLDNSGCGEYFEKMKKLWDNKDLVICEGKFTRLGIGNDLLDNCKSIKRVLCPATNAFNKYDEIINAVRKYSKDSLILLALGPTATVLAYDLAKEGYQALDVGHVDIEYEWFLKKATNKEKVENKYVNEVADGKNPGEIKDEKYESQIEAIIE